MKIPTAAALCVFAFIFVACTPPYTVPPSPPLALILSQPSLSFDATGSTNAQAVTVTQWNYTGTFTASSANCTGIATIASSGGATFLVTALAPGKCSFTITGGNNMTATLNVVVTTTTVGGS